MTKQTKEKRTEYITLSRDMCNDRHFPVRTFNETDIKKL